MQVLEDGNAVKGHNLGSPGVNPQVLVDGDLRILAEEGRSPHHQYKNKYTYHKSEEEEEEVQEGDEEPPGKEAEGEVAEGEENEMEKGKATEVVEDGDETSNEGEKVRGLRMLPIAEPLAILQSPNPLRPLLVFFCEGNVEWEATGSDHNPAIFLPLFLCFFFYPI
uniref:Uncharacterized protein n=1 Tax=Chromera velia CCMP2878 TaxID=1169474 RepID=A0A0K6SB71_9ALVE|eukprot:Cvel_13372.t2-p1 / transcript=Cvel_13372.t2 / gene=Cvel_13372 / organism=Chromera_velia_CCMP2878 / gene_product=hypothetical protein / transcript_product=hypothetical protein / location=Cvel_scaffold909:45818-58425(-) / protein_length=165 / sequence_SO=supercontig / SO=protein_coding / is_pseudo=false